LPKGELIEITKLTKIFKKGGKEEVIAINNANFTVNKGEIFGLLGPNGAGKTTTLRIISTILKPTSGDVKVSGHSVTDEPDEVRKNIGFLTGETRLYERLTPREIFFYFGRLYNMQEGEIEERLEEIVPMLELKEVLYQRVSTLSSGWKQRVSIGRTVIHNPEIFVLDEPLTGLDILARRSATEFIKQSKEQGKAVIFSTHVMSEAEELCDRVGFIHKGDILDVGDKEGIKEKIKKNSLEETFIELMRRKDEEDCIYN